MVFQHPSKDMANNDARPIKNKCVFFEYLSLKVKGRVYLPYLTHIYVGVFFLLKKSNNRHLERHDFQIA